MTACPRCGHDNKPGAKNCYQCGVNLKAAKASVSVDDVAKSMQAVGCWLTLFVTIPVLILLYFLLM